MFFMKLMKDGGPVMWIIVACSILGLLIFFVKLFQFHRDEISVKELMRGLFNVLKRDGFVEALTLCDSTPGPVAKLLSAGILAYQRGDSNITQALDDAALDEIPRIERYINILGTLAYILPLLGFLGTVLGMLNAFEIIRDSQYFTAGAIGGPIAMALITTAAGLTGAIPCHIAYNYLVKRVESMVFDMEKASIELTAFFERQKKSVDGE